MCGVFQICRIDKCIIWLVTTVLPLSSSGTVPGCCIPTIINSSHLQSWENQTQNQNALLSVYRYALKVTAHQIVAVSWPVCLAFIKFCFHLLLTESLKILTVSDGTVLYEILFYMRFWNHKLSFSSFFSQLGVFHPFY